MIGTLIRIAWINLEEGQRVKKGDGVAVRWVLSQGNAEDDGLRADDGERIAAEFQTIVDEYVRRTYAPTPAHH